MATEHYFSEDPDSARHERSVALELAGRRVELQTLSGTFSPEGLDRGTAALLRHVPTPTGNTLVDVGCGWGPLAVTMATMVPDATVYAVDVNTRALEACAANAAKLGLDNIEAFTPDQWEARTPDTAPIDTIWSNPPIRIGKKALHELLRTWLHRLAPEGQAWLVVSKSLGAETLLRWINTEHDGAFHGIRAARDKGFWILHVTPTGS
ncbi:16S rRNA G1207 methylase [Pontimonas salivibrio]|uniref:16S rRNA G1207 methylase n=1 Tax=Pontimonas salivibrio TaxID=1159327 RepID=A0A2L2BRS0_9MICO|nr:methyltransferase [Pontimonas salivibrio]AVG24327.1 16S rRNA G1207 methylase [Pontimonas salivibrio]